MFDPNEVEEPFFHVLPQAIAGVDNAAVEDGLGELNVLLDLLDPPLAGSSPAYLMLYVPGMLG